MFSTTKSHFGSTTKILPLRSARNQSLIRLPSYCKAGFETVYETFQNDFLFVGDFDGFLRTFRARFNFSTSSGLRRWPILGQFRLRVLAFLGGLGQLVGQIISPLLLLRGGGNRLGVLGLRIRQFLIGLGQVFLP